MIFATVGTHHDGFPRLLDAIAGLEERAAMVVQYGYGDPPPGCARAVDFLPFPEMMQHFEAADRVITHAGVGSVLCARRTGHVPVAVPRLRRLGEHVDDHQADLTRALGERGAVIPVWDVADLASALRGAAPRGAALETGASELQMAVREALLGRGRRPRAQ